MLFIMSEDSKGVDYPLSKSIESGMLGSAETSKIQA